MRAKIILTCRLAILICFAAGLFTPGINVPAQSYVPPAVTTRFDNSFVTQLDVWCLAGGFNGWNNASDPLFDDGTHGDLVSGDGIFTLDYSISSAGRYEWKVFQCGTWNGYPASNSWLNTTASAQVVKFTFDTNDHTMDAGWNLLPVQYIVNALDTLPSSFTAVGSFNGWNNADPLTVLTGLGNGLYRLAYTIPVAGSYIGKVTTTGVWDAFGSDGRAMDAANVNFTTSADNQLVIFLLDTYSGRLTITPNGSMNGSWCAAGSFNGWNNTSHPLHDDGLTGDLLGGDGIFSLDLPITTAGRYEWKVFSCGTWDGFPTDNSWLNATIDGQTVKLTFDINDHSGDAGWALLPAQNIVNAWDSSTNSFTAVGDFNGWNNGDPATLLQSVRNGLYSLTYSLTAGTYNGKVTSTGNWDAFGVDGRSVNATNVNFQVENNGDMVVFLLDYPSGRLAIIPQSEGGGGDIGCQSGASHDDNIWWADLSHDSRDSLYRTPGGPVTTGTEVTLRFRSTCDDLTAVRVRVWNDRLNAQSFYDLSLTASDEQYDWWEVTLPASSDPTVYWYRFLAIDGPDTDYYEDDSARTGGLGKTFDDSPDNSWQLTIYDPSFQTPDWVKDAIVYQIFPDRFRDGDEANDTPAGSFFYGENSTIYRSNADDWNTTVCDPRDPAGDCPQVWSQNFYGGDLQGVIDQLDYLESLGVTAIYFNPIFESPSNHKYDTTNYRQIDDNFGNLALFEQLASEANARGMKLVLDGVFNHSSSDSLYFDRYSRYDSSGACEDPDSPYRDWYFFQDVTPGSGPCVGSDGTPEAATYTSWFGYDSLPKLNSNNPEVRQFIWDSGPNAIGPYWVMASRATGWRLDVGGDVDPGTLTDPDNDYWEGFREAVRDANPETYITGEEWGYGSSWLLENEWDAVMNYQFSSAVLSFWRDEDFVDNDHNPGSSAGVLTPLTPSQLDERLKNLQERYPGEAFYAMLNLLGSHDTNRALFMLDHNTDQNNDDLYQDPNYDWSDAIARLKGVVILQMTLPGAPTVYYGDEIGLVGPVTYDDVYDKWEDDPYNRQPYPWLDESGLPFYTHLQSQGGQAELLDHYTLLTTARNAHPALRTGSFDTLLVDDTNILYAYGRKLISDNDAAVVVINRLTSPQDVTLDVSGYMPLGAVVEDVLNGNTHYTVQPDGTLSIPGVPGMFGSVLVLVSGDLTPPASPTNLVAMEGEGQVVLDWDAVAGADSYNLYRSPFSGGGYTLLATTTEITYLDTDVLNGQMYYYIVRSVNSAGLESENSNEVSAMPHYEIDNAHLQWPLEITHTIGLTPTEDIYGQVLIEGVTSLTGPAPGLLAQVGFGPTDTLPADWEWWVDASFNMDKDGGWEEWMGNLTPEYTGEFYYVYRFSTTNGRDWVYADLAGIFTGMPTNPGLLHVQASDDTLPPDTPQNLAVTDWGADFLELSWEPVEGDPTLYAYDLFRSEISGTVGAKIARILPPDSVYTDTSVTSGITYYYVVQALDSSFNRSGYSNQASGTPQPKLVEVTFNVTVPDFTPGTVYLVGDQPELGNWDPGAVPMMEGISNTWTITRTFLDAQALQFKFTRGNWETVEKGADGNQEIANRELTVDYGMDGHQTVNLIVANWRDPIVSAFTPLSGITDVPTDTLITVTWNQSMTVDTDFAVSSPAGPVSGNFEYDDSTWTVTFTPDAPLVPNTMYTVSVQGQVDAAGDVQQVPAIWSFQTTGELPFVQFASATYSVDEASGTLVVTVTLSAPTLETVTVDYSTVNGSAIGGEDYLPVAGTLTFSPQQLEQTISLTIFSDSLNEIDETFTILLSNPQYAELGEVVSTTITILDDDLPPPLITTLPLVYKG